MSPHRRVVKLVPSLAVSSLLVALCLVSAARAQTMTNSFGGLSQSSDQPIDIESDTLTVYDAKKYATFKGNVKAVQGTTTLRASELDVHYVGNTADKLTGKSAPQPGGGAQTTAANAAAGGAAAQGTQAQIQKIEARGNVVITSENDQTTTSDWALYDVPGQLVTVGGNVVLTQGQNVLKGDRLVIDLKTGESRFENTGNTAAGGRIRALFMPNGESAGAAESDGGKATGSTSTAAQGKAKAVKAAPEAGTAESAPAADSAPLPIVPESR